MKAVIQRVTSASVTVDGNIVGAIGKGLCVLVGIMVDDTDADANYIVNKLVNLRVFNDPATGQMWKKSAKDLSLGILCVSQFTLYGKTTNGNKPDFHLAMKSERSKEFYHAFLDKLRVAHDPDKIQDGVFGAMMDVNIANDGPVTLIVDSRDKQSSKAQSSSVAAPPTGTEG
ncbi:D-Tyr tRNAtyr deacylase-like domain-containing protein [Cladochytrium replicatum]|nr:D-Tyr tRNAtyr deacylase-like domain-containing protein [Cladochytrium replicatum]